MSCASKLATVRVEEAKNIYEEGINRPMSEMEIGSAAIGIEVHTVTFA
jgi:hypothetical protein